MQITDSAGRSIIVTDINDALQQAAMFMDLQHTDKRFSRLDRTLKSFRTDIFDKLIAWQRKQRLTGNG